jgi:hypothetical protein
VNSEYVFQGEGAGKGGRGVGSPESGLVVTELMGLMAHHVLKTLLIAH